MPFDTRKTHSYLLDIENFKLSYLTPILCFMPYSVIRHMITSVFLLALQHRVGDGIKTKIPLSYFRTGK